MGKGYLTIRLTTANAALPVVGAKVTITDMEGSLLYTLHTDQSGITDRVELYAPPKRTQFDPNLTVKPYSRYIVNITAEGFNDVVISGVQIYDMMPSELPVDLQPFAPGAPGQVSEYPIGDNALEMDSQSGREAPPPITSRIHREVFIPTHITVHLGIPASNARNITVPFVDYVKNVASSEIFPDWPYHALRANIHAQISLALNRVFTEWYRGKGYNFDITNSTQYDQYFVENRNIFQSVSVIADEIFNTYIVRPPGIEPFFAEYCSGITVTCPGMKQWGTVTLAEQGRNYLQILQYYYGSNIYIQTTNNIRTPFESFPGNLAIGFSGQDVAMVQAQLARIRQNYPRIPAVTVDGVYGSQTVAAVREFQAIFGLAQTGTVDRRTWYAISNIYAAVMRLGELGSEGHRPPVITQPPPPPPPPPPPARPTLRLGSRGDSVRELQTLLASRGFNPGPIDGIFGSQTQNAVILFQRANGLAADGVVGPITWNALLSGGNTAPARPPFPGTLLRLGASGPSVTVLQQNLNRIAAVNPAIPRLVTDGIFGPLTQAAVIAFQRYYGLTPDGIVGPLTWNRLMELEVGVRLDDNTRLAVHPPADIICVCAPIPQSPARQHHLPDSGSCPK